MSRSRHQSSRSRSGSRSLSTGSSKRFNRSTFRVRLFGITLLVRPPRLRHLGIVFLGSIPALLGLILTLTVYGGIFGTKDTVELQKYKDLAQSTTPDKPAPDFVFSKILKYNGSDVTIWKSYVSMLQATKRPEQAEAVLGYLTEETKLNDPELNIRYAELLIAKTPVTLLNRTRAEKLLRQAGEMNSGPLAVMSRRMLALLYIERGEREAAVKLLTPVMNESSIAGSEALWIGWTDTGEFDRNQANRVLQRMDRDLRTAGSKIPFDLALAKARMLILMNQETEARDWLSIQPGISDEDRQKVGREIDEMALIASIVRSGEKRIPEWSKLEVLLKRDPDNAVWVALATRIWAGPVRPGTEPTRNWVQKRIDDDTAGLNLIKNAVREIATIYNESGKTADDSALVRRLYRKLLNHEPDNVIALNNLAMLMYKYEQDHLPEALDLARKAERLSDGKVPAVRDTIGQILARMGRLDEAQQTLEQCVAQLPKEWGLHNTLAQIYERRGMIAQAKAHQLAMSQIPKPLDATYYEFLFKPNKPGTAK